MAVWGEACVGTVRARYLFGGCNQLNERLDPNIDPARTQPLWGFLQGGHPLPKAPTASVETVPPLGLSELQAQGSTPPGCVLAWRDPLAMHQQPKVNHLGRFQNDDLPCRVTPVG